MRAIDLVGGTEIIAERDCWELLMTAQIGRVAVTVDGQIEIFPVNYDMDGEGIIFRTNAGRKMTGAMTGEVAFEVDSVDVQAQAGWSVIVHGTASNITTYAPQHQRAAQPWTGSKDFVVRISPTSITGRRVVPPGSRV